MREEEEEEEGVEEEEHVPRDRSNPQREKLLAVLTRRSDMGVLSAAGRCCSRANTMQLAMMVARIMYSNGV